MDNAPSDRAEGELDADVGRSGQEDRDAVRALDAELALTGSREALFEQRAIARPPG